MTTPIDKILSEVQSRLAEGDDLIVIYFLSEYGGYVIDREPLFVGGNEKTRQQVLKQWRKTNAAEKALRDAVILELVREGQDNRPREELLAEVIRRMRARRNQ